MNMIKKIVALLRRLTKNIGIVTITYNKNEIRMDKKQKKLWDILTSEEKNKVVKDFKKGINTKK